MFIVEKENQKIPDEGDQMKSSGIELDELMERYGTMLFRVGMILLANEQDAEDAVQETFFKYLKKMPAFRDQEHEKAWFIKVVTNICRDTRRYQARHPTYTMETYLEHETREEFGGLIEELSSLPEKYKIPVYLHYIEGYSVKEIASLIKCSQAAVKKQLQRGREALKIKYEKLDQ